LSSYHQRVFAVQAARQRNLSCPRGKEGAFASDMAEAIAAVFRFTE
jgi:hypothetical protein